MSKTIKELADELGVSKTTVSRHLQRLPQHVAQHCCGRVVVDEEGEYLLKSTFSKKRTATRTATRGGAVLRYDVAVVEQYEARIAEKDSEIAYLRELLAAKILSVQAAPAAIEPPQEKLGFFTRLFRRP